MLCLKTFTYKYYDDFENYEEWLNFIQSNKEYAKKHSKIDDFIGHCKESDLPMYHPQWKKYDYEILVKKYNSLKKTIELSKINHNYISEKYGMFTTLENLNQELNLLDEKLILLEKEINIRE